MILRQFYTIISVSVESLSTSAYKELRQLNSGVNYLDHHPVWKVNIFQVLYRSMNNAYNNYKHVASASTLNTGALNLE
jgi:hypothetical protein